MMHAHWDKLGQMLLGSFPYISHSAAPKACAWTPDRDVERIGQSYLRAEAPYKEEVERGIAEFCRTGRAPQLSDEAAYFAGIRGAVVEHFVLLLGSRSDHAIRTVFLMPPDMTIEDSVRWLFCEWWECHGPRLATYLRFTDDFYGM